MTPHSSALSTGVDCTSGTAADPRTTEPLVNGRYLVLRRVGVGASAVVYSAEDLVLQRRVVLKVLHAWFAEDEEAVGRFRREASRVSELDHPNIVRAYGTGAWNGRQYIALEYVPGPSLKSLIREQTRISPARAVGLTSQLLFAVRYIHRRGIIHRDLKPDNVIVGPDGQPTLIDFGIACPSGSEMTQTANIVGTAHYMSPEQASGERVGSASDLYSLGAILHELLTGRVPFEAETAVGVLLKHVSQQPTRPSALNPAVSPALDAIVLRALEKHPTDRFRDADAFIAALAAAQALGRGQPRRRAWRRRACAASAVHESAQC
jgi:eukaryotic-like serine/threonine-protein kinase